MSFNQNSFNEERIKTGKKKILLLLLPFWTPLIPPQGISQIKGYLQKYGYHVKTVDVNLETRFKRLYDIYFNVLRECLPAKKHGNFYNIGNDVWREHMMAHINYDDDQKYNELVKILVYKIFFHSLDEFQVNRLNEILTEFYTTLEIYFRELLENEKPDVLGLSVYRDTLPASLFAFRLAKKINPNIMTVMGGSIFSVQLTLNSPNLEYFIQRTENIVDKIIIGEGELLLKKILDGELPEDQKLFTKKDIGGDPMGFVPIETIDFSDFDPYSYHYSGAQGSSSCPNQCSFCNVASFYGKYKRKDVRLLADEMIFIYNKYKGQLFYMLDALVNDFITELSLEFIKRNISIYWDGYLRVDKNITEEMAHLWRRGGFYRARMGIESGSQNILNLMEKGITIEQTKNSLSNLASAGIKTTAYIVIGHPGETDEDFQQTLEFLAEMKNDIWEAECNPFTYLYSGQSKADSWSDKRILLYPEWAKELLICQTWIVNDLPSREVLFERIFKFVEFCNKIGVSTPWSMQSVNKSDERWKRLHKNSVPSLLELIKRTEYIEENKFTKERMRAETACQDEEDFEF